MAKRLNSKHGEGVGGPVESVEDPNKPSHDPATHTTTTDQKITALCQPNMINRLTEWEQEFLIDVYGVSPLTRMQHVKVARIYRTHFPPEDQSRGRSCDTTA